MQPFHINIPQPVLDNLMQKLQLLRWPDEVQHAGWEYGTNLPYMQELAAYWQQQYNWRQQEAALNRFPHFKTSIEGKDIHFIYARGKGPHPVPIIITHGWPGSFYELLKIIPLLTEGTGLCFDVIIPSIPGFGFSTRPQEPGWTLEKTAHLWHQLMTAVLGYSRYAASGTDFGSGITRYLALHYPQQLIGIYLSYVGFPDFNADQSDLTAAEQAYLEERQQWMKREGGYAMIQSTKPQTLSYALNDSPVGLAAWLIEKFQSLSDCNGVIETRFTKDELLTNIMIYWVTQTIPSSIRTYYENARIPPPLKKGERIEVPAGISLFKGNKPPIEWVERSLNVQHWTDMPRGGHFAAMEEPALLAADMQLFFQAIKNEG